MAKWGKADFGELKKLIERVENFDKTIEPVFTEAAEEVAKALLNKVKKRTLPGKKPDLSHLTGPDTVKIKGELAYRQVQKKNGETVFQRRRKTYTVLTAAGYARKYWSGYVGGNLRRQWSILPVQRVGSNYVVTVINNAEYASYVEYGHRQRPGRFVPALGKCLKASFVPGKYMLTISTREVEKSLPRVLERKIEKKLREVFGDGKQNSGGNSK